MFRDAMKLYSLYFRYTILLTDNSRSVNRKQTTAEQDAILFRDTLAQTAISTHGFRICSGIERFVDGSDNGSCAVCGALKG